MRPIKITDPKGVIAAIPYLLGEPPQCGMVALVTRGTRVQVGLRKDFDDTHAPMEATTDAARLVAAAQGEGDGLMLIAYGPGPRVTPYVDAVQSAVRHTRLTLVDALRVHEGRYWSYTCQAGCCPAEGVPFDPDQSTVPAEMVARGEVRLPAPAMDPITQARLSLAPVEVPEDDVKEIVADTVDAARRWADPVARAAEQLMRAVDAEKAGQGPQDTDDLVRLAVYLRSVPARDRVWAAINPENASTHTDLWSKVTRSAPRPLRAAPASLVAVAAWTGGELPLAQAGVRVALDADPSYSLAQLVQQALTFGLPVERWLDTVRKKG
ncbi:DUF4192 domain-containing protein [Nocardiopsis changdeensis]|uniref:DUF4192 domain-containing protein n=1 Tax=Nocardiopsis changdeensis TaxID=2831969 RepID=A0A975KQE9_9ACTN|nr:MULTISPECIES: DUF4192 domain-containing protein [Nocardiopsis]QUX26414.1 DUF4192 domain-containing protein [Nocardiopsis changdeensis]QYX40686.1 DUF4192 domain-containing protein [Nocardiopsis sp. MT53]